MTQPLVSVVLPIYNAAEYLDAALSSIRRQSHTDLEIIAIDDGSTDKSLRILLAAQMGEPRLRIVTRENKGLIATLNEGLDLAEGRFIARMDADDLAYPGRLAAQLALFAAYPGMAMCGTGFDTLAGSRLTREKPDPDRAGLDLAILAKFYTIFIHSTVMYDTRVLTPDELYYDKAYPHAEDFDLFRRIAAKHPVGQVQGSQVIYRLHEASISSQKKSEMRDTHVRIVTETLADLGLPDIKAMTAVLQGVTQETVERIAAFLQGLDRRFADIEARDRASYREGFTNLFYFFYRLIRDADRPHLTSLFLRLSAQGQIVRRRERVASRMQRLMRSSPLLWRGLDKIDWLERRLRSHDFAPNVVTG